MIPPSASNSLLAALKQRISGKSARVAIVGLGYVGLPLACRFASSGLATVGLDIDLDKIRRLENSESYLSTIPAAAISEARERGFTASSDFSLANGADAIIICVPTPLTPTREPDLSYVENTVESLLPHLRTGQLLSLESTTYPGTTEEILRPKLERADFKIGEDFFLVFSPEREDPGNPEFSTRSIPKICGGSTPACLEAGLALYSSAIDRIIPVSSTRVAEMTKLLENIHRAVNIGLANEMKIVADRMGIDIHEVIRAAATKPFGFVPYYPGPGLGGHCIPIDPFYLTWKAREFGINTRFIELAGEINRNMPSWVVDKIASALNNHSKSVRNSRIMILGIAYKKNVDDVRESPAAALMELLRDRGALLSYSDPFVPHFPKMREHRFEMSSTPLSPETLATQDCVVLVTDHDQFDFELIARHSRLVIDSRGRYLLPQPHIVKA